MKTFIALITTLIMSTQAFAQLKNESTLGLIIVDGNSQTETTSLKQVSTYSWEKDAVTAKAGLTETREDSTETAKSWDAALRYDHSLSERTTVYASHAWESNRYAGYLQRETADLGLSYKLYDTDAFKWKVEAGYSYRTTDPVDVNKKQYSPGIVAGTDIKWNEREGVTYAFRANYRHDLDSDVENHTVEAEPSIAAALSDMFSLKLAYLIKSQARITAPATEHTDTTFTTNLVANF